MALGRPTFTDGGVYAERRGDPGRVYLVPRRMMDDLRLAGRRPAHRHPLRRPGQEGSGRTPPRTTARAGGSARPSTPAATPGGPAVSRRQSRAAAFALIVARALLAGGCSSGGGSRPRVAAVVEGTRIASSETEAMVDAYLHRQTPQPMGEDTPRDQIAKGVLEYQIKLTSLEHLAATLGVSSEAASYFDSTARLIQPEDTGTHRRAPGGPRPGAAGRAVEPGDGQEALPRRLPSPTPPSRRSTSAGPRCSTGTGRPPPSWPASAPRIRPPSWASGSGPGSASPTCVGARRGRRGHGGRQPGGGAAPGGGPRRVGQAFPRCRERTDSRRRGLDRRPPREPPGRAEADPRRAAARSSPSTSPSGSARTASRTGSRRSSPPRR